MTDARIWTAFYIVPKAGGCVVKIDCSDGVIAVFRRDRAAAVAFIESMWG